MLSEDTYGSFQELSDHEVEGIDFDIKIIESDRPASIAILAPHGGWIEPHTSEIASAIAGNSAKLYLFQGLKKNQKNRLHLTSNHFDEPRCLKLITPCQQVVTIHGCKNIHGPICLGGLDAALKCKLAQGVQFELSRDFRESHKIEKFVKVVRDELYLMI